jgi:hypothetical protein
MPKSRTKRARRPPPPRPRPKATRSPPFVGALFFVLLLCGVGIIIGNYVDLFGDGTANWRLWYGLGLVTAAFVVSTRWR